MLELHEIGEARRREAIVAVGCSHRRLRAAGVSFEDRQDLIGHRSGRITTHYSATELENLIAAAEKVCGGNPPKIPTMVLLKQHAASGTVVIA